MIAENQICTALFARSEDSLKGITEKIASHPKTVKRVVQVEIRNATELLPVTRLL